MGQSVYTRIIRGLPQLPVLFKYVFAIWTVINVFFVWRYWDMPNHDDALAYEQLALGCIEADTYYPAQHNLYDLFTFGPGYVNLLIGLHTLTGSIHSVRLLNLIMNCLVIIGILLLGKRLFNKETGFLAAILYMFIYSNAYVPIAMLTDLPFTFLGLAAILFCTSKRVFPIFIAGMCLATANWIRPLVLCF